MKFYAKHARLVRTLRVVASKRVFDLTTFGLRLVRLMTKCHTFNVTNLPYGHPGNVDCIQQRKKRTNGNIERSSGSSCDLNGKERKRKCLHVRVAVGTLCATETRCIARARWKERSLRSRTKTCTTTTQGCLATAVVGIPLDHHPTFPPLFPASIYLPHHPV